MVSSTELDQIASIPGTEVPNTGAYLDFLVESTMPVIKSLRTPLRTLDSSSSLEKGTMLILLENALCMFTIPKSTLSTRPKFITNTITTSNRKLTERHTTIWSNLLWTMDVSKELDALTVFR
jgi:hypothetical protein